ncbi:putative GPI-anchored protein pfl2 [Stylophora pistillata]|uniref:putative GPI-anchored protein pfl2 n=1 Tax=Stylophora pistillata TaxID=50429 RepID=UPI000C0408BC|nr:putative GPI-anchored protein pfl2 [Stylophora pistillata]
MSSLKVLVYTLAITVWLGVSSTSMSPSATVSVTAMDTAADASGSVMISSNGNSSQLHAVSSTSMSLSATVAATTSNVTTKAFPSSLPSAKKGNPSVVESNTTDSSSSQPVSATSMVQSQNSVSVATSFNSITRSLFPSVSQSRILAVSNNSSLYQTRSETSVFRSMTQSPTVLPTKNMNISANSPTLALSQSMDGGNNSVNISRSSYSAHSSFISEISPRLHSPLPSSSAVFIGKASVSTYVAAKVTSNETPSVCMPSASGQSSKKTYSSYSAVVQSSNVIQSTPVESSSVSGKSSSEGLITMTTQHLGRSLITSMKNITISARVNATPSSPSISPVTSAVQPRPTLPPQGTKLINMEVSFDLAFKEEYNDPNSPEYKSLERNLTIALENVYKSLKGFVGVRIFLIKKGSVVCRFIVILAKDSEVDGNDLTETLQKASESGKLGYVVKNIEVKVEATTETVEKLPEWALVIMILLGCLAFIFLIALIHFCVKYRRSVLGDSDGYFISSGEVELVQTYDKVENNKNRGYQGQKSAINRRVIASHTNPTFDADDALGD